MMLIHLDEPGTPDTRLPLLRLGFRPFYLLAALFAAVAMPWWLWQRFTGTYPGQGLNGMAWHAHEMIFGYVVAVIAGFLLTAVRNWTGAETPTGRALAGLCLLWLLPRLLLPFAPVVLTALADLLFLPILAWVIRTRLRAANNTRNRFIPRLLGALALLNLGFYLAHLGWLPLNEFTPMEAALMLIVTLEVVIGGRIIPSFTKNALPGITQRHTPALEHHLPLFTATILLGNLLPLPAWLITSADALLALMHAYRVSGWGSWACRKSPLLWVLHGGYWCIPAGIALLALAPPDILPRLAGLHLLAIGATGGLTIAMLTRTALGHTGRPLRAGPLEHLAYLCIFLAAACRLLATLPVLPGAYQAEIWLAGLFWSGGFLLYLIKYVPILGSARVDGKAG
ncbi:NnrS family protein [Paludibacterium sp. THUN1379]|uniref:NnrS family protein n=1 Tax=Paludibacterium sp. THUN1379 TaxID=3112107 RepID=UPI0030CF013B